MSGADLEGLRERLRSYIGRAVWDNLPLLLTMDLSQWLAGAAFLGPMRTGVVAATARLVRAERAARAHFLILVKRYPGPGVAVTLVSAVSLTALLGPVPVGGATTLALPASFSAYPLARLGGCAGGLCGGWVLGVATAGPMATAATVVLLVLP